MIQYVKNGGEGMENTYNIIHVDFKGERIAQKYNLWQYDYNQILQISGLSLPATVEIHFSLTEKSGKAETRVATTENGITQVQIPNELLRNDGKSGNYSIFAFIYVVDEDSGNTEYEIILHVDSRPAPGKIGEDPDESHILDEAVNAVNAAADRAEAAEAEARSAADSATAAAESARKSAEAVAQKKNTAISVIQNRQAAAEKAITDHTDAEIARLDRETQASEDRLTKTIRTANDTKEAAENTISEARRVKESLDISVQNATKEKEAVEASTSTANAAKKNLDQSTADANVAKTALDKTIQSADDQNTSLGEKIETSKQLKTDLQTAGEKATQDIQTAGSEQLGKMQAVAEEFTADREQITTNKEDISSLKEDKADKTSLAQTDRKLDALWKLNQGISYEFQTDDTEAYQKDIPSGAKLASVKKIGGRTIVWNQLVAKQAESEHNYGLDFAWLDNGKIKISGTSAYAGGDPNAYTILKSIEVIGNHKYLFKLTGTDRFYILGYGIVDNTPQAQKLIFNALDNGTENITICGIAEKIQSGTEIDDIICPQIYDLTQMFGTGNEPATVEEFEALFPEDYYPYNEGELMSIAVNEVAEQGKNYFDFSRLVSDGINVMDYEKQTITIPAYTNNTGYNQTLRDLCPGITPGTYVFSIQRSNPESGAGSYFLEDATDFPTDTPIELTDELLDNHISWYNNPDSNIENVISEIQIEKNSAKTSYSQYYQKSHPIPQAILDLDGYGESENFVDFAKKKYHKGDKIIDISDIIGDTFQDPIEVEPGGTLTFRNTNGNSYRVPVPNEEEYLISLAEVSGND